MKYFATMSEGKVSNNTEHTSIELLSAENGCRDGCCSGISIYYCINYSTASCHEDQEGFFVLEGYGWARVGDEEFKLEPEISFIVPAGVNHCIKSNSSSCPVKVLWFHSAILDKELFL